MCDTQQLLPSTIPSPSHILVRSEEEESSLSSLSSSLSSPKTPPTDPRMHIHIDMSDSHYLSPGTHSQTDSMQVNTTLAEVTCSSSGPAATVAYAGPDLTPFSAVSSFNYPAATDPTLLTPVSSAGSPPTQHRGAKAMHPYPTPPTSSKMFCPYDVNVSSQSSSPMTVHPASTDAFEISYLHNASPRDDIPPQQAPYFGSYSVSEATDAPPDSTSHFSHHSYDAFVPGVDGDPANFFGRSVSSGAAASLYASPMVTSSAADQAAPILSNPHPSQFRHHPRGATIEDLRDPSMLHVPGGIYAAAQHHSSRRASSPREKRHRTASAAGISKRSSTTKPRPKRTGGSDLPPMKSAASAAAAGGSGSNQRQQQADEADDENRPQLTLDETASEEDRFIFEKRQELAAAKGKGMWDILIKAYEEKYKCTTIKATLQMRLSRAVRRSGVWPAQEEDLLLQVYLEDEEKRFARYTQRLKELGGCRAWNWQAADIEYKLVRMGLEEPLLDDKSGARRRKRNSAQQRRRSAAAAQAAADVSNHQQQMAWATGMHHHHAPGPHHHLSTSAPFPHATPRHHHHQQQQHPQQHPQQQRDESYDPSLTSKQEEDLLEQLDRKYTNTGGLDDEADIKMEGAPEAYGSPADRSISQQRQQQQQQQQQQHSRAASLGHNVHSERVARQACEQMIAHRLKPYGPA